MRLYNTLTRKIEPFQPTGHDEVRLYTCGPTVYDYYHIGNLRNAVFNDTLRRVLEANNWQVKHIMNITDVGHLVSDADEGEDKLEKGAQREGKTVWDVAEHYTQAFKRDMRAMHVLPPNGYQSKKYDDTYARATEFIPQQIELIQLLLDKGHAYQTEQAIYFEVSTLKDYGILSGQKLSDKETAARSEVVTDKNKRSPYDFAVWFFAVGHFKGHSMRWDSPWGEGFPGWHLECSAIVHTLLGDPIDIHTGGVDHIGTHHPNEMAQTEAAYGHPLSHFWVHNEFVLVDGKKMSKSKHNAFTLKDITDKGYDPLAYRLLVLQAHYRTELSFSWDNLQAAKQRLNHFQAFADLKWQLKPGNVSKLSFDQETITKALKDDLNTPEALAIFQSYVATALEHGIAENQREELQDLLAFIDSVLGLNLNQRPDISDDQKALLRERQTARDNKAFDEADALRQKLQHQGIHVRDTSSGQLWNRS